MRLSIIISTVLLVLLGCARPPPPAPIAPGLHPPSSRHPGASARSDATRDDTAEATVQSDRQAAKEDALNYVVAPKSIADNIDQLSILTAAIDRANTRIEQHHTRTGTYRQADLQALRDAVTALEVFLLTKHD
jgi:hypothetical protein